MNDANSQVLCTVEGAVALITLNRPEKRNALNDAVISSLKDYLHKINKNEAVRAVVITGSGTDFCAGADLAALQKMSASSITENLADAESLMELLLLIRRLPVPVVAAVRGKALAGGCGLATACDIVLAARTAQFGYPEVKIGFVPAIVTAILRRNVSEKRAFELITRGAVINADEAERIGIVNRIIDDQRFEAEVEAYVAGFEKVSRSSVMLSKRLLYHMDGMTYETALQSGVDSNTIARMTEDCQQGIRRFLKQS